MFTIDEPGIDPLQRFTEDALARAAGERGQGLVDAAVQALVDGLDTPTLRILAGATRREAEADATEFGPKVFDELGLDIERFSDDAYMALARLNVRRFTAGHGEARELARSLTSTCSQLDYPSELVGFYGLHEAYHLVDDGVLVTSSNEIDAQVAELAAAFLRGEVRRLDPFAPPKALANPKRSQWRWWQRRSTFR